MRVDRRAYAAARALHQRLAMSRRHSFAIAILWLLTGCGSVAERPAPLDAHDGFDAALDDASAGPGDADAAGDAGVATDAAIDGPPQLPPLQITVEPQIGWSHQTGPVTLGASAGRLCFLVGVSGQFSGTADVRVIVQGGAWILDGTAPGALGAVARCISWSASSNLAADEAYGWSQDQAAADMGPASNRLCVLTRMGGSFVGGGELVRTAVVAGRWQLDGTSLSVGVVTAARCLTWPADTPIAVSDELLWANRQDALDLGGESHRACALTLVAGGFAGFGENISLRGEAGRWLLGGAGAQDGIAARARCMTWP